MVIIPAGAVDKEAAVHLLTWMTSPEIVAEALQKGGDPAPLLNEIQTELGVRLEGMRTDGTKP